MRTRPLALPLLPLIALAFCVSQSWVSAQEKTTLPFADRLLPALFNKKLQSELELVSEQKTELEDLLSGLQTERQSRSRELKEFASRGKSEEEIADFKAEIIADLELEKQKIATRAMKILLPHQRKRLEQVTVQYMMQESAKQQKVPSGLLSKEMREFLKIDEAQAKRIQSKSVELQKKLLEQIQALTEDAKKELLKELTKEQQKKYSDAIGKPVKKLR